MATIKSFTDINQSRKLAEILPLESADMVIWGKDLDSIAATDAQKFMSGLKDRKMNYLPCWSLAALLNVLSEIKPQVYTPILFPSEGKWILQFAEYGHGNICEVTCDNPVDACYEMILKLHELDLV